MIQFLPLSIFADYASRYGVPTDDRWVTAFQLGGVTALPQLIFVLRQSPPMNRLVLGANVWLFTGGLAAFTQQWWLMRLYGVLGESGIFLFIAGAGVVTTLAAPAGFIGAIDAPPAAIRRASLCLLGATCLAMAASVVFRGNPAFGAALPVMALALLQRTLVTRVRAGQDAPVAAPRPMSLGGL